MSQLRPLDETECYLRLYGWVGEGDDVVVMRPHAQDAAPSDVAERMRRAFEARLDDRAHERDAA